MIFIDGSSSSEESDEEDASKDLSRGRGNVSSSSEEGSGDEDDVGIQKEELVHPWAELAADAPATDEITRRLALVNMDWDYIRAEDIFALLNSYKPVGGQIKSVTIYPSEFGLKRMKEEEWNGPLEMKKEDPVTGKPNDDGDQNESEEDGEREDEGEDSAFPNYIPTFLEALVDLFRSNHFPGLQDFWFVKKAF